jgi:arylformamidase
MEVFDVSVTLSKETIVYPGDPKVSLRKLKNIKEDGFSLSELSLGLHSGTHVDAPSHYLPKGKSVDKLPLIAGAAKVFDLSAVKEEITVDDLRGCDISSGDVVLFRTRNSSLWKRKKFSRTYVSISVEGARYLVRKKVAAVGIDYLSVEAFDSFDGCVHKILLTKDIPIIEGLDLGKITPGAYTLVCLPLKIVGGEAAPARCILIRWGPCYKKPNP